MVAYSFTAELLLFLPPPTKCTSPYDVCGDPSYIPWLLGGFLLAGITATAISRAIRLGKEERTSRDSGHSGDRAAANKNEEKGEA